MRISDNVTLDFHHDLEKKETACILNVFDQKFIGTAKCGKKDVYDRRTGRKVSFLRVLAKSSLSKEGRTKVWQGLRERKVKLGMNY